jgi:hypothetical protein
MSRGEGVKNTHTGTDGREYLTAGSAIDLLLDGPYEDKDQPVREWTVLEAPDGASLTVVTDAGIARTYSADLLVGITKTIALRSIAAGSTSGIRILVTW